MKGPDRNSGSRPIIKDLVNALCVEANKKITMNQKYFIGIDVSKEKLDCALILSDYNVVAECIIPNNLKRIKLFLKSTLKKQKIEADQLIVCCETKKRICDSRRRVLFFFSKLGRERVKKKNK